MRIASIIFATEIAGLQIYLFRRIKEDLVKNHVEGPKGFRELLSGWEQQGFVTIVEDEIRFWNGSKIYLCHCKDEKHRFKYQGAEIHLLLIDELTHFTETIYRYLRGRCRMVGINLPTKYRGRFPCIIGSSNPGGLGHQWVKSTFIDPLEPMEIKLMPSKEGGMKRQYIPAKVEDNPSLATDDPDYVTKLMGLGSEELVEAMLNGDWDQVEGAFFNEFSRAKHVVHPFSIPNSWTKFRSFDWGSAKPFSVGWWAVAGERFETPCGKSIPRGALVRYREYYGCVDGKPDTGLKLPSKKVAENIREKEYGDEISYGVADPAIFAKTDGPSVADNMMEKGVIWRKANNKRISKDGVQGGWDQLRDRLEGDEDTGPMIYWFSTCLDSIRLIPSIQHDSNRPEDLDTNAEDHILDETRYACMSRPFIKKTRVKNENKSGYSSSKRGGSNSWKLA
ncbi:MAG: terminase [Rhizobiales bacterium]|nr:terminase [Hyphomicrobiales bacterium]